MDLNPDEAIEVMRLSMMAGEALKRGMLKGIAPSDALESNPQKYVRKTYGVNQNAETIADVIATWMQDEK